MSGKSPRVNVVVTREQHRLLLELSKLQGRSAASFLREMLDAGTPMLQAMLPVFRSAAEQVAMQPQALAEAVKAALSDVDAQRAQMSLLGLLAATTPQSANDSPSPGQRTGPSDAREDFDLAKSKARRKA